MTYIKNFIFTAIFISALFAGQALESAKIYIKDKDWVKAEKYLEQALIILKTNGKQHSIWEIKFFLENRIGNQLENIWI